MRTGNTASTFTRADLVPHESYEATYCPEDDKIRLYVGRVPREEYNFLRAEGWISTPKQSEAAQGEFSAVWNPSRKATAIQYAGSIGDEDTPPTERAADRAERFGGYMEKRADEAAGHADSYESQPSAHGFQSERKAERAAARHDRQGTKAADQWSKAEYWQRRTAGVIQNALHKSSPEVRMGRIKTLEAELRKAQKEIEDAARHYRNMVKLAALEDPEQKTQLVLQYVGSASTWERYLHPRASTLESTYWQTNETSLYSLMTYEPDPITGEEACALYFSNHGKPKEYTQWSRHFELRLTYENQMLEAQGGRAAFVEMEAGGFIGKHQITKVTKSPATGRVVSVEVEHMSETNQYGREWSDSKGPRMLKTLINIERMGSNIYRAPTDEERTAYAAKVAAAKKEKAQAAKEKAAKGENCPLINPTDEDAERLQALWNDKATECGWYQRNGGKPSTVLRMTQAQYSANSGGSYAGANTATICEHGTKHETRSGDTISRHSVFKIRATSNGYNADRVIVITDKPQKAIPWAAVKAARAKEPTIDSLRPRLEELAGLLKGRNGWLPDSKTDEYKLMQDARYVGIWSISSMSQFGWTDKGAAIYKASQQTEQLQAA